MSRRSNFVPKYVRLAIYDRDNFCCAYCKKTLKKDGVLLSLDHVIAENTWKKLGKPKKDLHKANNLVTACHTCNSRRRDSEIVDVFGKVAYNRVMRQVAKPIDKHIKEAKLVMESLEYSEVLLKVQRGK